MELLEELNAEGITMVVITHNPEIAARFPRRIALRDGRVEADGAPRRGGVVNGNALSPSRMHFADLLRTSGVGLRTRKLRTGLSALGIMIGIASLVAVLGLSESSKSDLLAQLDRLGTNLLVVQAGQGIGLGNAELPDTASAMVGRIGPVEEVSAVGRRRRQRLPDRPGALEPVGRHQRARRWRPTCSRPSSGRVAAGRFLDEVAPRATRRWSWAASPPSAWGSPT